MTRRVAALALDAALFLALACVLLGTVLVLLVDPSEAASKKLLVATSERGPYAGNLTTPLFDGEGPFVPRDHATTRFWVKNNSSRPARATLAVVNRGRTNGFERGLRFDVSVGGTRSTGPLTAPGEDGCNLVTTGRTVAPGGVQAVDVALIMDDLEGQLGTDQTATLDFVLSLGQVGRRGDVRVCGQQAATQPYVEGEQGADPDRQSAEAPDCDRDVVVAVTGKPPCVPTVVDAGAAGIGAVPAGNADLAGLLSVLLLGAGAAIRVSHRSQVNRR